MAIDFILATAPANLVQVKNFLVARGIVNDDGPPFTGTLAGFEYTTQGIPNPFVVSGSGTEQDPYVYDTKRVFLFRFSHELEADEIADDTDPEADNFSKSKAVKWVKANGTQITLDSANGWSANAWRVSVGGVNVFLSNDLQNIGVWQ